MKIGITGTRNGFSDKQKETFLKYLEEHNLLKTVTEFHQGNCIGVDVEAARIFYEKTDAVIHAHLPEKKGLLGTTKYNHVNCKPKNYLARNRDIVNSSDIMFAIPREMKHQSFGGTWYTHDYSLKQTKKTITIFPDGSLLEKMG